MEQRCVSVSAPGKVLICGGYLVVEKGHTGVSLGLSARFHCVAHGALESSATAAASADDSEFYVRVHSHQFAAAWTLRYRTAVAGRGDVTLTPLLDECDNAFVAAAVSFALLHLLASSEEPARLAARLHASFGTRTAPLSLHLYADNPFYSQANYLKREGRPVSIDEVRKVPAYQPIVGKLGKTGLGSSACLVTSIVGCVLAFFEEGARSRDDVHAVAQLAHCHAQGKIGSGFDVASAAYGSSEYERFAPAAMNAAIQAMPLSAPLPGRMLRAAFDPPLDHVVRPCALPLELCLALADVNKGSSTPGMVSAVFKWKKECPEAPAVWAALAESNANVARCLRVLRDADSAVVPLLAAKPCAEWGAVDGAAPFVAARDAFAASRALLRKVGAGADVEIEPEQQTALLEHTLAAPGVLAAGCPGAGGYDAVFAICLTQEVRAQLAYRWESFESAPHGLSPGSVCALAVDQDNSGGMVEKVHPTPADAAAVYPGISA